MEVITAGEDIRAWQTAKRKLRAISATTNGLHDWLDIAIFHRLLSQRNNVRMLSHFVAHVVIVIVERHFDITITVQAFADHVCDINNFLLTGFELRFVEITDDVMHFRTLNVALDGRQMVETFVTFCMFGRFICRQLVVKTRRQ